MSYAGNVIKETEENHFFRKVVYTGEKSQLVVMEIPVGGDVGEEIHEHVEQWLFFEAGTGKAVVGEREWSVGKGDVVIVAAETRHNFFNVGSEPLKIYTIYVPANHIDARIHNTKADAKRDAQDKAFGECVV